MVKVKICGITSLEDAKASTEAGCDGLGFVFYKKSPRYIEPEKVAEIVKQLPARIKKIGVFVNAKEKEVRRIAKLCKLDIIQFHGIESPQFCKKFKNYKVIKAFRIKNRIDLQKILKYKTFAYLFDTFVPQNFGGTGKNFNWKLLKNIDNIKCPIFLSGGLNARNVGAAIKYLGPDWVDVSSSIEIKAGKKDHNKIRKFIKTIREVRI